MKDEEREMYSAGASHVNRVFESFLMYQGRVGEESDVSELDDLFPENRPTGCRCGHASFHNVEIRVPHGNHMDFVSGGRLHHFHGDHCDDHGPLSQLF
jgi:hypothetical protein